MRYVILLIIAVISFALLGTFMSQHDGVISISLKGYPDISTSFWFFALSLFLFIVVTLILFRVLWWVVTIPGKFKKYRKNRKSYRANSLLQKGMLAMGKGHWKRAESILIKGSKYSESAGGDSSLFLSTAAIAAQNQGANDRRDKYLLQARHLKLDGIDTIASSLTEARINLDQDKPEKALKLMSKFDTTEHSSNLQVLNIKIQANIELHNFADAFDGLSSAKKQLSKKDFYEKSLEIANMTFLEKDLDMNVKQRIWDSLTKPMKQEDNIILSYASALLNSGEQSASEKLITKAISKNYSSTLISAYSQIEDGSPVEKLKSVKRWLNSQPDSAGLNYAASKFSFQSGNFEEAKAYAKTSLKAKPEAEAFTLLGAIYEALDKKEAALHSYKAAINFSSFVNKSESISGEVLPAKEEVLKLEENS